MQIQETYTAKEIGLF